MVLTIKSTKNAEREKRMGTVRISYLSLVRDLSYLSMIVYRISLLSWEGISYFQESICFSISTTNSSLSGIILPLSKIISPGSKGFRS